MPPGPNVEPPLIPSWVDKSITVPTFLVGFKSKTGRVHLCRVAGNTVILYAK